MTSEECNQSNILPVELIGSTLIKRTHEIEMGFVACRSSGVFPRHSVRSETGKLQVCKHSSDLKVMVQSVEGLMANFPSERKVNGENWL